MNRPASVTVFGVLSIVFGTLGLLGTAFGAAMLIILKSSPQRPGSPNNVFMPNLHPVADAWTMIGIPLGMVFTIVLIVSGIGLLRLRPWGRKLSLIYVVYTLISVAIGVVIQAVFVIPATLEQARALNTPEANGAFIGAIIGMASAGIGLIYPGLLWYFMTRPHVLVAFGLRNAPAEGANGWAAGSGALPEVPRDPSNPYSAPRTSAPLAVADASTVGNSVVDTFIPAKNGAALASYYLGLFSLFPCLGFPLAVAAIIYGAKGLKAVRQNPEVRGGAHAWVGVICGSLFGLMNLCLIGLTLFGFVAAMTGRP